MNPKNILITGASGLIGKRLTELLTAAGHSVSHLGRNKREGKIKSFVWDVKAGRFEREALDGVDTIIHLAGANVSDKRWSPSWKKEIRDSRIDSLKLLHHELSKGSHKVSTIVSASAIGYYGFEDGDQWITETHAPGKDFLSRVVEEWEQEADRMEGLGIRVVKIRVGIVLSDRGGALKEMTKPISNFVGAALGSGNQYISWIHLDDICNMFIFASENQTLRGAYNGTASQPVTNRELTKRIASVLKKPLLLPAVPYFVLKLILGEMADIVVHGSKVSPEKIRQAGFRFRYDDLDKTLHSLLRNN